ncbi:hypothetical protein M8J76_005903 [Diaphorina citri]|nr:hypothetical protein M8J76_005903 [Diaphorina citri]
MNNNFQNQQNWSYNNHQNNQSNYGPSFRNNGPNFRHQGSNFGSNRHNPGFQNNRFSHHSNMNRNYNRNVSNYNSNHGNYNNYNSSYNNRNMNPSSNNFNNRYTQHNYDSRNDYKPQSNSNHFSQNQHYNQNKTSIQTCLPSKDFGDRNDHFNYHEQKVKSELHSRDGNLDTKKIKTEMETNFDSDSIKKEKETDQDSLRVDQEINVSKPSVKSNTVKSDKIKQVKSEPIEIEDVQTENSSGDTKCSRPIRASKRAKPNAKPIIDSEDSEEEEVDIKPIKRTRRQKVESSDDEYVPEEPIVNTTKAKSARTQKTTSAKVKSEDIDSGIKEKPARKPRVTKKVKLEENINTNITKNVTKPTKATAKRSTKKAEPKQPRKSVKTEIDSEMCGEDVNSDCEKETTAKKRVGTKRKLKAPADTVENEESETVNKKTRKVVQPNETYWSDESLLAEMCSCDVFIAWNFIKLIKSDNTIPFIARYRKEMVMNYEAEKLREMKQAYENILEIHHKAETILSKIEKLKKLTPELRKSIACCKSLEELDLIYSPYKVGSKGTKAEKAKKLGLETPALELLNGEFRGDLRDYVKAGNTELNTVEKVQDGIQHIVADILAKDTGVLETLQELVKKTRILLESTKTKQAETIDNFDKYETYFSYSCDIKFVKPHAVLAINRGESNKVLSVNVKLNEWLQNKLFEFCKRKWLSQGSYSPNRARLFELSFQDSFKRLIKPFIVRSIRTQLNQTAEIASIQVFASNLKQLLLVPPMHGAVIMAIDPGYSHGCKVAVIDTNGNVLVTDTLYIKFNKQPDRKNSMPSDKDMNALKLRDMVLRYKCELVAIGNGTACRETETYMSDLIQKHWFEPLNVCYTIISEQDPNVVSAISLARRLQDPLSELVKIEPKHLGVGMYQHDVPEKQLTSTLNEKQLTSTLNEVVSECVSFVGVDINCASQAMLRRLAGLTDATAANIVKYRTESGGFKCREDLRKVKGIGEKRFEQCAGFVRISCTEQNKGKQYNPLDSTWIHPEAYETAHNFARNARVNLDDLGKDRFIAAVNSYIGGRSAESWAEEYATSATTMGLIIEAFRLPRDFDLRSKLSKPLFKKGIQSLDDIASGTVLTGKVDNVTHFGCFVDIGLERAGLIHISKLKTVTLKLNDKVTVKVLDVDKARKRVGLELVEVLS